MSFGAVHLAFHPCSKLQGITAKANKFFKSLFERSSTSFPYEFVSDIELEGKMVKNYQIKWKNCQTWRGSRCPHQQIIEELALLIELKNLSELKESFQSEILKKANSCCEKCEYFKF
jgi:hypothetical protein